MLDFLGFAARSGRGGLVLTLVAVIAVSCTDEGNYFDEPPPSQGGHAGVAGAAVGGGSAAGGSAGLSAAGGTSAGRAGSGGGGASGTGGSLGGGSGGSGGTSDGARGGEPSRGGSAGVGGTGGGTGGMGGGSAGVGGATGGSGTGGTSEGGDAGDVGVAGAGGEACVPALEVCDGVSNDCDEQIDEGGVCPTACTAKRFDGHVYLLCMTTNEASQLVYNAASTYCEMAGDALNLGITLELARIEAPEESNFARAWVRQTATADGMVWIGANDLEQENKWMWGRGAGAVQFFTGSNQGGGVPYNDAFNDFGPDRPNASNGADEDCGAMDSEFDWAWNDILCMTPRLGYLCEQTP